MAQDDGPTYVKFNGEPGGYTMFPFSVRIFWDWAMEQGLQFQFLDHAQSQLDFKARISGKLEAHWDTANRHRSWFRWDFNRIEKDTTRGDVRYVVLDPEWTVTGYVRQGQFESTESLFREIKRELVFGMTPQHYTLPWENDADYRIRNKLATEPWSHIRETARVRELRPRVPGSLLSDPRVVAWAEEGRLAAEPKAVDASSASNA